MSESRPHEHREPRSCCCSIQALEPHEDCPVHGHPWPPRCVCGKFMPWPAPENAPQEEKK